MLQHPMSSVCRVSEWLVTNHWREWINKIWGIFKHMRFLTERRLQLSVPATYVSQYTPRVHIWHISRVKEPSDPMQQWHVGVSPPVSYFARARVAATWQGKPQRTGRGFALPATRTFLQGEKISVAFPPAQNVSCSCVDWSEKFPFVYVERSLCNSFCVK